jgi:hypothetical protein
MFAFLTYFVLRTLSRDGIGVAMSSGVRMAGGDGSVELPARRRVSILVG